MEVTTVVVNAWDAFSTKIVAFLPLAIGSILIFFFGWIAAKFIRFSIERLLRLIKLDEAAEYGGVKAFLARGNIHTGLSKLVGQITYWFIMIIVVIASLDALGLPIVSDLLNDIVLYLPRVAAAVIVVVLGALLGSLVGAVVETSAANAGVAPSAGLGIAARYAVILFAGAMALVHLGIGEEVVWTAFLLTYGAVALGLALAFGLGGREIAARKLDAWLVDKKPRTQKK